MGSLIALIRELKEASPYIWDPPFKQNTMMRHFFYLDFIPISTKDFL